MSSRTVPGVLDYQGSALDSYLEKAVSATNVALQMPTGSGKTLIGLLIGEWRRRKFSERVLYLCPTNQLARQVADHAGSKYGLRVTQFKGAKKQYKAERKAAFESGETIAVTSYSALFNSNPYFLDSHIIILDDCHVAENYMSSPWLVEVDAGEFPDLFQRVAQFAKDFIRGKSWHSLVETSASAFDRSWADLLPLLGYLDRLNELIGIFDESVENTRLYHPWSMIRGNMSACNVFLGSQRIVIRPICPPTMRFEPFAEAKQRFFMSATLGEAGNFERMTGVSDVLRLPTPPQLSKEAVGRRFFIFPGQSLSEEKQYDVAIALASVAGRSVLLVPSKDIAKETSDRLKKAGLAIFSIEDLEEDKDPFVASEHATAVLAGRYDGLDFRDGEARLLTIDGMPGNRELQELFLRNKAHAAPMLEDRIRSRVIQASGRCTRSENDYSAVLVLDDTLMRFFRVAESRKLLPVELQAEVLFGLEQAKGATEEAIAEQFASFLDHGVDWQTAEEEIMGLRVQVAPGQVSCLAELKAAAAHELAFCYAMWDERYVEALSSAKSVIDALKGEDLKGYKAFWELQAATAARCAIVYGGEAFEDQVTHMLNRASKGLTNVDWLLRVGKTPVAAGERANSVAGLIERLARRFDGFGISTNVRFNDHTNQIRDMIANNDATTFERGVLELGRLLGFEVGKIEEEGTPDPWWQVDDELCFVFEAHSGGSSGKFGSAKSRQAALQGKFIREKLGLSENASVVLELTGFRGHFPLGGERSTNGQKTPSLLPAGVPA